MTYEMVGSIIFFMLTVFAVLFTLGKSSQVDAESFPNRGRYYTGLFFWLAASILAVFMSFPGYGEWFVPIVYPLLKISFMGLFLVGLFMLITTVVAFPVHMNHYRRDINGRSDRIALLDNIRQIASQPYPLTELFTLVLRELGSFLVVPKGAIFLVNPSRREMYLVSQIGFDRNELTRMERFPLGQDIISRSAIEQAPFVSGDLSAADSASRKLILAGRDIGMSVAAIPLNSRDRSLGTLVMFSDKPYRFEKRDRMLLNAAAEALAGVVEASRLTRENQKLAGQFDIVKSRLDANRTHLALSIRIDGQMESTKSICRYLAERYGALACRIVRLVKGDLEEITAYAKSTEPETANESYRIAVVDAIMQKKMVILNQEASRQDGSTFVTRSTLLCPLVLWMGGDCALLVEAPGESLNVTEAFMADIESQVALIGINLNINGLREAEKRNRISVASLLNILKIKHDVSEPATFKHFLEEVRRIMPTVATAFIFIRDQKNGYRLLDSGHDDESAIKDSIFLPGEGPVGKAAATGEILEYISQEKVEKAWEDLEPINQDFFSRLYGEQGIPDYQINIPIKIFEDVVAVISLFGQDRAGHADMREKGILLLAVQLLSIKLSMSRMHQGMYDVLPGDSLRNTGHILNHLNNDLATILGRGQLLARQADINGRTRYTTDEIIKAAESAADAIKRLQESIVSSEKPAPLKLGVLDSLQSYLDRRRVTGNLYMFEDNRPVMLQMERPEKIPFVPRGEDFNLFLETTLKKFVTLLQEGEEVLFKTELRDDKCYISLVRGNREHHRNFDPTIYDFGDPDVIPRELADESILPILAENKAEVSFDRFGRRPTYLSFRFDCPPPAGQRMAPGPESPDVAGLKILAIDDQQMILDLLTGICASLGLKLTAMQDPEKALAAFKAEPFDIVMVDLAMGDSSGWDIARELKAHAPGIPVILMTGWGIDISAEDIERAGVDFTLVKPFKIEQLTEVINKARLKNIIS